MIVVAAFALIASGIAWSHATEGRREAPETSLSDCQASAGPVSQRNYPEIHGGNVGIEYYRFVLVKHDDHLIALHLMPDPRHGWDGITYRWYHLANGKDDFFRPSPEEADSAANPALESGSGETHEGKEGSGLIQAGPLSIKWSKGGLRTGWLYLSKAADVVQVYPEQFDRIDEFSGKLDSRRWKRAH
jgi:hypothetical protein